MKHWNKYIIAWLSYGFFVLACALPLDGIVAVVNDDIVTRSELQHEMRLMQVEANTDKKDSLQNQALNRLIDGLLIKQLAERSHIIVEKAAIDASFDDVAKRNHMTRAQLIAYLKRDGMTEAGYRDTIRRQILVNRFLQQNFAGEVHISNVEVQRFIKNLGGTTSATDSVKAYHVANLLWPLEEIADSNKLTQAQQRMVQIQQQLMQGKTLEALQTTYSQLQSSDLGWRTMDELPTVFVPVVKTLHEGQWSQPIRTPNGVQLVQLLATRDMPLPTAKTPRPVISAEQARAALYQRKLMELAKPKLKEARKQAYIKITL